MGEVRAEQFLRVLAPDVRASLSAAEKPPCGRRSAARRSMGRDRFPLLTLGNPVPPAAFLALSGLALSGRFLFGL